MSKEAVIEKLKILEGFAGKIDKKRLTKSSDFSGLKGKPNTKVRGSSEHGLYYDSKGLLTTGYGDLVETLDEAHEKFFTTEKEASEKLDTHYEEKKKYLKKLVPKVDTFNPALQEALVIETFRGSVPQSENTLKLINQNKFTEASKEYLDNDEYRSEKQKKNSGIAKRMEEVAKQLKLQKNTTSKENVLKKAVTKKKVQKNVSGYNINNQQMNELRSKMKGRPYSEFLDELNKYRIME